MDWNEIFKIVTAGIASIGSASLIIIGLSTWLGKVWANRILETDKLKYQSELEKLKKEYELRNEQHKLMYNLYSQGQFTLYNELWIKLIELQENVDKLWEEASVMNLKAFVNALLNVKKAILKSALLLEKEQ